MIANKTNLLQVGSTSIEQLMDHVLDEGYAALFQSLRELTIALPGSGVENCNHELILITEEIFSELDTMFRKEKFVLFPYIKQLSSENKKTNTCTAFKNIKFHTTVIARNLLKIKQILRRSGRGNTLLELLYNFESKFTSLQSLKEKNIFNQIRSCSSCSHFGEMTSG